MGKATPYPAEQIGHIRLARLPSSSLITIWQGHWLLNRLFT
ncbi:hypothetical protein [Caldibacillus sp. 210928-DFI.2.22]|nr:hypothetical protein [Caldibacillus sp. 210928-DFI.2.22]